MAKIFVITSGKGGVGKTTTAVNLGAAINSYGENVVVVDANFSTPNIGLHLGAPIVPIALNHVLNGDAKVDDAIYGHYSGTKVIPSSLSIKETRDMDLDEMKDVIKKLRKLFEYVILDSAAGLGEEALSAIQHADELIIVTNPEMPSVTDALKAIKIGEEMGKPVRGVIITRARNNSTEMPYQNVKEMLEVPILGVVPEEDKMQEALARKDAIFHTHPKSKASKAYKDIAAKLIGRHSEKKEKKGGFWQSIMKSLGIK